MKTKNISKKQNTDLITKVIIFVFSSLAIVSLILMASFILKEAIPAYKKYGLLKIYFTSVFENDFKLDIWSGLLLTLITSISAIAIALPLSLRTAIFMRFRVNKTRKFFKIFISILAGVPSVVFGIFALKSLSGLSKLIGSENQFTLINSILMLVIMIFPTLTSLIYNQLKLVDPSLLDSSIALGNTKTCSIYKVVKKSIKPSIYVASIVALGRAIGETMALSMILYAPASNLHGSFKTILNAPYATLGVEISRKMFQDGSTPLSRSILIAAGIALFLIIMILIGIITKISKSKKIKIINPFDFNQFNKEKYFYAWMYWAHIIFHALVLPFKLISYFLSYLWKYLSIVKEWLIYIIMQPYWLIIYGKKSNHSSTRLFFKKTASQKRRYVHDYFYIGQELVAVFIVLGSSLWILFDVMIVGTQNWALQDWVFSYKNQAGKLVAGQIANPLVWTIVLILIAIFIAFPFALATAIFLSEYARNKKSGTVVKFFLDSLGGMPSILFGIFGMIFFLDTMGLRKEIGSTSLIAGGLTMFLVIIPTFTRAIEQVLVKIPNQLRTASYSLGASKFETIRKILIPQAMPGIASGTVLSVGRIISETAPIYLTLGMFPGTWISPLEPGHTLTTDILKVQVFSNLNANEALKQSYKLASVAMILVAFVAILSNAFMHESKGKKSIIKKVVSKWKRN